MNNAEINVEHMVERADELVDKARKVLAAVIVVVFIGIFLHNNCWNSTKSDVDHLRVCEFSINIFAL